MDWFRGEACPRQHTESQRAAPALRGLTNHGISRPWQSMTPFSVHGDTSNNISDHVPEVAHGKNGDGGLGCIVQPTCVQGTRLVRFHVPLCPTTRDENEEGLSELPLFPMGRMDLFQL